MFSDCGYDYYDDDHHASAVTRSDSSELCGCDCVLLLLRVTCYTMLGCQIVDRGITHTKTLRGT